MHELSLCASIAQIAGRSAAGRRVTVVRLQVGELRQVVPDTLVFCWALVVEGTPLDGATLEFERIPGRLRCTDCGGEQALAELSFRCAGCGSNATTVIAGEEFLVTSIDVDAGTDLDTAPAAARAGP